MNHLKIAGNEPGSIMSRTVAPGRDGHNIKKKILESRRRIHNVNFTTNKVKLT